MVVRWSVLAPGAADLFTPPAGLGVRDLPVGKAHRPGHRPCRGAAVGVHGHAVIPDPHPAARRTRPRRPRQPSFTAHCATEVTPAVVPAAVPAINAVTISSSSDTKITFRRCGRPLWHDPATDRHRRTSRKPGLTGHDGPA